MFDDEGHFEDFVKGTVHLNYTIRKEAMISLHHIITNFNKKKSFDLGDINAMTASFAVFGSEFQDILADLLE